MIDTLITKSILSNNPEYLQKLPRIGLSDTEKALIEWLDNYYDKHSELPTKDRFLDTEYAPYWNEHLTDSPFSDIYDLTLKHLKNIWFNEQFRLLQEKLEIGEDVSSEQINAISKQIGTFSDVKTIDIFSVDRSGLYNHDIPENVVNTGWLDIDLSTGGIYPGEVCLFIARPGTGKSLISFYLAVKWAREKRKVLVISSEMAINQMVSRFDAMLANFNPLIHRTKEDFKLLDQYAKEVSKELDTLKTKGGNIIFPHQGTITTAGIRSLINTHTPDVVIVDGVYCIENGSNYREGWQKEADVIKEIKQIAIDYNLPLWSSTQVGRNGGDSYFDLSHIAGSDMYGKVTDIVIGAWPFVEESRSDVELKIVKNRNGKNGGQTTLLIDWKTSTIDEKKLFPGKS